MILQVESREGPHGEREPVAFQLGAQRVEVLEIVDRWLATDYSYYKLTGSDRATYIVRHMPASGEWNLTLFQTSA